MQNITVQAEQFFELLKLKDTSMWEIFAQMIDGNEKELIFLDHEDTILFNYILPATTEKLEEDRKEFSREFADKMAKFN
ncbi:hypothetical protein [Chryseobacterium camelliae]|uniref:hypothetical protein n=1 Tax=Chryseobacterium camelliae TaxID=1265445 RepID=UPI000C1C94F2|nr:hypothetical protein [Chryseobacterium camelliae]